MISDYSKNFEMTKKRNKFAFSELKTKCSLEFEIFYFEKWNLRQDMKAFRLKGCEREMKALSARPMFRMKSENFQRTGAQKFFSYKRKNIHEPTSKQKLHTASRWSQEGALNAV